LLACYGELARFREFKEVGSVHPGAPPELVLFLKQRFDLRCFVETGTLFGNTASWAARVFPTVYTIEAEEALWEAARRRHAHLSNVRFILGQSPAQLSALTPTLDRPLFWLDAHWSGGYTAGEKAECPLLDELAAISAAGLTEAFILIDDARMFLSPPPLPHKWQQWPALSDVMNALRACANPWITVKDDVIIAVPPSARDELAAFWRRPPPGHSRPPTK
jgi:hypothetical protein